MFLRVSSIDTQANSTADRTMEAHARVQPRNTHEREEHRPAADCSFITPLNGTRSNCVGGDAAQIQWVVLRS